MLLHFPFIGDRIEIEQSLNNEKRKGQDAKQT